MTCGHTRGPLIQLRTGKPSMKEALNCCKDFLSYKTCGLSVLTLMGEDAVEIPKEMLGKEGDVYKLSIDTEPSGRNSLGCEGHLCIRETGESKKSEI